MLICVLYSTAILGFITSWNEYLFSGILSFKNATTATVGTSFFITSYAVEWGNMAAAITLSTIPTALFIFIAQKGLVKGMKKNASVPLEQLRVDGGPTKNAFLMQFQSDILTLPLAVPGSEELSGIGAAYAAGLSCGLFDGSVFDVLQYTRYTPAMEGSVREAKLRGWHDSIGMVSDRH